MIFLWLFKVSGHSMEPKFKEGQIILASSLPYFFRRPKVGDVVVTKDSLLKRIKSINKDTYLIEGDNLGHFRQKWIKRTRIIGKVINL